MVVNQPHPEPETGRATVHDIAAFLEAVGVKLMMEYKGYTAEVEFDDSVGRLHGRVINSGAYPIATFEATDVEGIRREFHRSINEYLKSCEEDGIEPRKPFSGKLNVRLGPDLHQRVARSAAESGLSLNSWVMQALEKSLYR